MASPSSAPHGSTDPPNLHPTSQDSVVTGSTTSPTDLHNPTSENSTMSDPDLIVQTPEALEKAIKNINDLKEKATSILSAHDGFHKETPRETHARLTTPEEITQFVDDLCARNFTIQDFLKACVKLGADASPISQSLDDAVLHFKKLTTRISELESQLRSRDSTINALKTQILDKDAAHEQ